MSPRRSVERDYKFYDPPEVVWNKMNASPIQYSRAPYRLGLRDMALMCVLYWTASRVSEIVRANVAGGYSPSIQVKQFVHIGDFVNLRLVPIHKRHAEEMSDYPLREEIPFPTSGYLSRFTTPVLEHMKKLRGPEAELFPITTTRAYQIVNEITGEFPHYLREMGLKFWLRVHGRDIVKLKTFSGHVRIENLVKYLADLGEEDRAGLLTYRGREIPDP